MNIDFCTTSRFRLRFENLAKTNKEGSVLAFRLCEEGASRRLGGSFLENR